MKQGIQSLLFAAWFAVVGSGCVAVSGHSVRDVRVNVTEAATGKPAPKVELLVSYDYDGYGMFRFLRTPSMVAATTDEKGEAVMELADYRYMISLKVGDTWARLSHDLVRNGGIVPAPPGNPKYELKLTPRK